MVRWAARRWRALDFPDWRKNHGQPIPRLGGLAILVIFTLVILLSYQFKFFYYPPHFMEEVHFGWLFLATMVIFAMGVADDFCELSPGVKFLIQVIAGLIVALTSFRVELISVAFGDYSLGIAAIPVTVLWIVAITNALNLLDGLDGLAAGTSFIVSLTMFGISIFNQNIGVALVSIILAGSILGFLKYNFHPASIFLGNGGAYTLGFILSIISLQGNIKGSMTVIFLIPLIVLGLPLMDTALSMIRRLIHSLHIVGVDHEKKVLKFLFFKGRSVLIADRDHIHHRLLQMGFTHRKAVILLYAITLTLGLLALAVVCFRDFNQALFLITVGTASYIGVKKLGYSEIQFLRNGTLLPLFDLPLLSRRMLKVFLDVASITLAYYLAFLLRFEGSLDPAIKQYYLTTLPLVLAIKVVVFYFAGLYQGVWRYISVDQFLRILKAVILGCLAVAMVLWAIPPWGVKSWSILFIDFNLLFFLIGATRSSFRVLEHLHLSNHNGGRKILLYGVGKDSVHTLQELIANPRLQLAPVGFIDDDPGNQGVQIHGFPVLGNLDSLETILGSQTIAEIIVSQEDLPQEKLNRLSQICTPRQIPLRRFQTGLVEICSSPRLA